MKSVSSEYMRFLLIRRRIIYLQLIVSLSHYSMQSEVPHRKALVWGLSCHVVYKLLEPLRAGSGKCRRKCVSSLTLLGYFERVYAYAYFIFKLQMFIQVPG